MANPQYGTKVQHRLIDDDTDAAPITIKAIFSNTEQADAETSGTIYASPKITDISYKALGAFEEIAGVQGDITSVATSREGIEITFTLMPHGTTKAKARYGAYIFRVGAPVTISSAPTIMLIGHEGATGIYADILNCAVATPAFVVSHDIKQSTTGYTTGTITVRRYIGITTSTPTS
jgi:hypothetical protein